MPCRMYGYDLTQLVYICGTDLTHMPGIHLQDSPIPWTTPELQTRHALQQSWSPAASGTGPQQPWQPAVQCNTYSIVQCRATSTVLCSTVHTVQQPVQCNKHSRQNAAVAACSSMQHIQHSSAVHTVQQAVQRIAKPGVLHGRSWVVVISGSHVCYVGWHVICNERVAARAA
jgi:hypothetical protein